MKAAVIVFPGSNCDRDCKSAIETATGAHVDMVWHGETQLPDRLDLIVLPGGFAYGDYLRCGAIAALSPVMAEVKAAAGRGVAVAGICNGFQVLCEARMLPGALLRNAGLKYVCKAVDLAVVNQQTRFTAGFGGRRQVTMTVGNGEGNYFASPATLQRLEDEGRVLFRYTDPDGKPNGNANPNGAANGIAGVLSEKHNVLGLMPHPENHVEAVMGSTDGRGLFAGLVAHFANAA